MQSEIDEFEKTNLERRNQLMENQRKTLDKFDRDCLTRYSVNIEQLLNGRGSMSSEKSVSSTSAYRLQDSSLNNNLNRKNMINSYSSQSSSLYPSSSSVSSATSNNSTISQQQQQQHYLINNDINENNANINYLIKNFSLSNSSTVSNSTVSMSSSANYSNAVPGLTAHRASMVLSDYVNSSPKLPSVTSHCLPQQNPHHSQSNNDIHSSSTLFSNSYNNNGLNGSNGAGGSRLLSTVPIVNQSQSNVVTREQRSNSLNNAKTPTIMQNTHKQNPNSNGQNTPTNKRNSTAFT